MIRACDHDLLDCILLGQIPREERIVLEYGRILGSAEPFQLLRREARKRLHLRLHHGRLVDGDHWYSGISHQGFERSGAVKRLHIGLGQPGQQDRGRRHLDDGFRNAGVAYVDDLATEACGCLMESQEQLEIVVRLCHAHSCINNIKRRPMPVRGAIDKSIAMRYD